MIDKIHMITWDYDLEKIMLYQGRINGAVAPGTHHWHLRFSGRGVPQVTWPDSGYSPFVADPMDSIAIPQVIQAKSLDTAQVHLVSHISMVEQAFFWNQVYKGAFFQSRKIGEKLTVQSPRESGDIRNYIRILEKAILEKPRRIITTVPEINHVIALLQEAQSEGIEISVIDSISQLNLVTHHHPFPSVGIDDYQMGEVMASKAIKTGNLTGRALIVGNLIDPVIMEYRYQGIVHVLKQFNVQPIKCLVRYGAVQLDQAFRDYPDISAVFCLSGHLLKYLQPMLAARSKTKPLFVISFDKTLLAYELMSQGLLDYTVDCLPFLQGALSVINSNKCYKLEAKLIAAQSISDKLTARRQK